MAKDITLKSRDGSTTYYPKTVSDLVYNNDTGKTVKEELDTLGSNVSDLSQDIFGNDPHQSLQFDIPKAWQAAKLPSIIKAGTIIESVSPSTIAAIYLSSTEDFAEKENLNPQLQLPYTVKQDRQYIKSDISGAIILNIVYGERTKGLVDEVADMSLELQNVKEEVEENIGKIEDIENELYGKKATIGEISQHVKVFNPIKTTIPIPLGANITSISAKMGGSLIDCIFWGRVESADSTKYKLTAGYTTEAQINYITVQGGEVGSFVDLDVVFKLNDEVIGVNDRINEIEKGEDSISINIPQKIYAVNGDRLQLFHRSVIGAANPYNYNIEVVCSVGKNFPRYFEFEASDSHVGKNYALTYTIRRNDGKAIATKTSTIYVMPKLISPVSEKNILIVGASQYASGVITNELRRRLTETSGDGYANPKGLGLHNINFIGSKYVEAYDIRQEATGGYGWQKYATNSTKDVRFYVNGVTSLNKDDTYAIQGFSESNTYYFTIKEINVTGNSGNILCTVYGGHIYAQGSLPTSGTLARLSGNGDTNVNYTNVVYEAGNPFWNDSNNSLDFKAYSNKYCDGKDIDIICCQTGTNDFSTINDVDAKIEAYVKPFIRRFHSQYPNGKVLLGGLILMSFGGGVGTNYGASSIYNACNIARVYWYVQEKMEQLTLDSEFSGYVKMIDIVAEYDVENGYPYKDKEVNNRVSRTEKLETNGVHPTTEGSKMLSDSIYRTISYIGW